MQIAIVVITFICYLLVRKVKDTNNNSNIKDSQNPWQEKLYKKKPIKKFVDLFIPKKGTKKYKDIQKLLKTDLDLH